MSATAPRLRDEARETTIAETVAPDPHHACHVCVHFSGERQNSPLHTAQIWVPHMIHPPPSPLANRPDDSLHVQRWASVSRHMAVAGLAAAVAACGGGGGDEAAPPPAPPPVSPAPLPPAPAPAPGAQVYGDLRNATLGVGAPLNGAIPFPADNAWNADISTLPVDPNSDNLIASIGLTRGLFPDFGAGLWEGAPIGIPYVVVAGTQPRVAVQFTDYGDESDPGPYPIPPNAPIEGGPGSAGDRHVIVIDRDNNRLYETGNSYPQADGSWRASGGAVFHLNSNNVRPTAQPRWTSADAAGLPIFPGLVRYDEASQGPGGIRHALRFTVSQTRRAYVPPATHWASSNTSPNLPPMGMRVRLKASYVIPAGFSAETRAILTALKTHGMMVADNGSNWYLSGAPDERWNNDRLKSELRQVLGRDFEVVRMDGLVTP